jgi:hypothetical protein
MRELKMSLSTLGALTFMLAVEGTPVSAAPISPGMLVDAATPSDDVTPAHYRRYGYGYYRPYYGGHRRYYGYRYRPYYGGYRRYYGYRYRPHYYGYGPYYGYAYRRWGW